MLAVVFRQQARREFDEAADWYETSRPGLGGKFLQAVDGVLSRICREPEFYPIISNQTREALIPGFPYCVYYLINDQHVVILPIFHSSRNPADWQQRR